MTLKEADRLAVVRRIESKEISMRDGAQELKIGYRQIKRLWRSYKSKGAEALICKSRNRPSNNRFCTKQQEQILKLVNEKYSDYGPTLIAEKLAPKYIVSKETVRKWMIETGLRREEKRKWVKTHPRRTRRSQVGELIQIDGSYEFWFEERGEKCCLLVAVDDATSRIMSMRFCRTETTEEYLKLVNQYLLKYGRPLAFYSDKHAVFRVNAKERGETGKWTTQFHGALKELGIELICAHSPQAKGRVERANGILQDRMIKEMREKKISTIEKGNQFLDKYIEFYNKKFGKEPAIAKDAHLPLLPSHNLEQMFMLKEERTLTKDLSFSYNREIYQVQDKMVHSLAGKKIEIFEMGGEIKMVLKNGRNLKFQKWKERAYEPAKVLDVKELEVHWQEKKQPRPKKHHPWH